MPACALTTRRRALLQDVARSASRRGYCEGHEI
jgi:hypothetical protein